MGPRLHLGAASVRSAGKHAIYISNASDSHDIVDSIKEGEKAAKECAVEGKGFGGQLCNKLGECRMLHFCCWGVAVCKAVVGPKRCRKRV